MLSPFLLIYCLYKANLRSEKVIDIMQYLSLIIGLVIVVSNIFVFSYGSYSDTTIKANFFEWFNSNSQYTYQDLASKGLFEYGNQIGANLIILLPFIIYIGLTRKRIINWICIIIHIFSLILLCTKVSVFGIFIVLIYTVFVFMFTAFIQKKPFVFKTYLPVCGILLCCFLLLPINPMLSRMQERKTIANVQNALNESATTNSPENKTDESNSNIANEINLNNNTSENITNINNIIMENIPTETNTDKKNKEMLNFIESTYETKQLDRQFLFTNYPYKYDPEFWYNFLHNDLQQTTNYRFIEISMIKRVVEINNNTMDKWFGITNTRLQNIFNIERDFVVQYYALGIIGAILIFLPYFILLGYFLYTTIKNKFKNLNIINLLAGITIVFLFSISYFSGNLLNSLSFTIYFALCFYLLFSTNL